jgi:hypothetical protein
LGIVLHMSDLMFTRTESSWRSPRHHLRDQCRKLPPARRARTKARPRPAADPRDNLGQCLIVAPRLGRQSPSPRRAIISAGFSAFSAVSNVRFVPGACCRQRLSTKYRTSFAIFRHLSPDWAWPGLLPSPFHLRKIRLTCELLHTCAIRPNRGKQHRRHKREEYPTPLPCGRHVHGNLLSEPYCKFATNQSPLAYVVPRIVVSHQQ